MPEVRIYGASDDLVEFDGAIYDEFPADRHGRCSRVLAAPDGGRLRVFAAYLPTEGWAVGVAPVDNEDGPPIPDWQCVLRCPRDSETAYSAVLVIDVPDGTVVENENENDDDE